MFISEDGRGERDLAAQGEVDFEYPNATLLSQE